MANKFQVKRTSISGRTPNTTSSGNTHFIDTGELALNLTDGKMFSSNGTVHFEVGANISNLSVTGNASIAAIIANGSIGSFGQTLTSNGTGLYWAAGAGTGTVTQVNTGDGLSGGPIEATGTISVVANSGIVANSSGVFANPGTGLVVNTTGIHVNSTYIGTLTSNNSTNLNGQPASFYTNATNIGTGTLGAGRLPQANTTSNGAVILLDSVTNTSISIYAPTANAVKTSYDAAISANTRAASAQTAAASAYTNAVSYVDGKSFVNTSQLSANLSNYQTTAGLSANVATLTSNNSTNLNGQPASFYTNATNISSGTLGFARLPSLFLGTTSIQSTSAAQALSGITTLAAGNTTVTGSANISSDVVIGGTIYQGTNQVNTQLVTSDKYIAAYENQAPGFTMVVAGNTSSGQRGVFKATRARGTLLAPTVPLANDDVLSFLGAVYDGDQTLATAELKFIVDGPVSDNIAPQAIVISTGNTNSRIERFRVTSSGNVIFTVPVSGITTLATGNTTITGFANVSTSVNSALLTVGTSFIANTSAMVITTPLTANSTTGTSGQILASNGTVGSPYWFTPAVPVTSVTGTSPVVSSGGTTPAISLAAGYGDTLNPYASKTAKFILAAPNAAAGVPTFRAIVASDIPTLNQSTTGSAATLTTGRTIAISGAVTGTATSFNGSANIIIPTTVSTTQGGVVYGSNTTAFGTTAAGTTGQALLSAGTNEPVWTTLSLTDIPDAWAKKSVRAATTVNITLSGTQTIDGIAVVAGDRVLVKNQTTDSQNGIYIAAAGAWTRSLDADSITKLAGACVNVDSGTVNGGHRFETDLKNTDTLDTTSVLWHRVVDTALAVTSGSTLSDGYVRYAGTTSTAGQFYGGTTTPTGTTRLNYGGYFYPTFINLAGSGDTITAATHYFVETGSDGFVRPKTLANVRTEIVTNTAVNSAAASGLTAGNTTITGFANASVSVNSALLTVGTSFIANTTGAYHTGTVNAASHTVGTSFVANSSAITLGTIGAASNGVVINDNLIVVGNTSVNTEITPLQIKANQNDTASAPSYTWSGNTSTGFYRPATDTVAITVGGVEELRVNTSLISVNTDIKVGNTTSGFINLGRSTGSTSMGYQQEKHFTLNGTSYGTFVDTLFNNTAYTAARSHYGGHYITIANTLSQNTLGSAVGTVLYGLASFVYNAETTGGDSRLGTMYGVYADARNYANGTVANTVDNLYGYRGLARNFGPGLVNQTFGLHLLVGAGNNSITGNMANVFGVHSIVASNTGMTIGTGYLYYGAHGGTNTTTKYGIFLTNEANNYFSANVSIGGSVHLTSSFVANGTTGTSGQVLLSNGTVGSPYWSTISSGGLTIVNDTTTNATRFISFNEATSGSTANLGISSTKLTFNPSTGIVSATQFSATSDERLKQNVEVISDPLDKISQLRGVTFNYNSSGYAGVGVIAQDVEKIFPELVDINSEGYKSVLYDGLIGLLIESIKDQQKQINKLKQIIERS